MRKTKKTANKINKKLNNKTNRQTHFLEYQLNLISI